MKGQKLTYYLIISLSLTAVYTAAVLFYYDVPANPGIYDALIFCSILIALGFSAWFAIRYMDLGIKNLPELSIAHIALGALLTYSSIYLSARTERMLLEDITQLPAGLLQGKIFTCILMYILMVMVFYFTRYREFLDEREKREVELKSLLNEAELNLLKTQLNPHFIFNSLNSISSLTITDPDRARNMVVKLSDFLRYSLGKGKEEKVYLDEEIQNVSLFLDIEKTRFGDRLNLEMTIDDAARQVEVPILILQPLIENAVKYSVYDSIEGATIYLKAYKKGTQLHIEISNPYDPRDIPDKGKGIGLNNVRQRLDIIYGPLADINVLRSKDRFSCKLVLPVSG